MSVKSPRLSLLRAGDLWRKLTAALLAGAIAYLVLQPLVRLQMLALEDGGSGYSTLFDLRDVWDVYYTTAVLASGSVLIAVVCGTSLAWYAQRLPSSWRWMSVVPMIPVAVPAVALISGWAYLLAPRAGYLNSALRATPLFSGDSGPVDVYSRTWITIIIGFSLSSFVYLFVRSGLTNLNGELLEASRTSGASPRQTFTRVVLPLIRPYMLYGAIVTFLLGLGQAVAPMLLGSPQNVRMISTEMYKLVSSAPVDYSAAAALGSPLLIVAVVIVLAQRAALGDQARYVTHGGKSFAVSLDTSRWAPVVFGLYGVASVVLPLSGVALVAGSPFWSDSVDASTMSLDSFRSIFSDDRAVEAISNSLVFTAIAIAVALPLGFVAATVLHRGRRLFGLVLELLVTVPLGVPAILFGAGFLFAYSRPPLVLYGSALVVILVYVTLMLPFTSRMQLSGLIALGDSHEEAARVSGASYFRTKVGITLPLMRSAVGGAAAIMSVLLFQEFSASVLVRSAETQVMGTYLYDLWQLGDHPQVAALALVMAGISLLGIATAFALGGRRVLESM